jgi:hypothetical protein
LFKPKAAPNGFKWEVEVRFLARIRYRSWRH